MTIGSKKFDIGSRTFIVGILNVTPDSFFDGGKHNVVKDAITRALGMIKEGADIIEIGGESTRPGHDNVSADDQLKRVLPVLQELTKLTDVPISIDTSLADVARATLENGASMINDVWAFSKDPELANVCALHGAVCCTMHNRNNMDYSNILQDIKSDLTSSINILKKAGIADDKIITDPGIGFAKTAEDNILVLQNLTKFTSMPYPLMLGTSNKSFIGKTIGLDVHDRLEATLTTTALGISQGVSFIRVHNVKENKKAAMMADALVRKCANG